jgi:lipoprotein-releasing system permease protein
LRAAQTLFAVGRNVSTISVKLDDAFKANEVADAIAQVLPYKTESWMRREAQFMDALKAQNSTTAMISAFSLLASSLSIAAVLIVSVIQKSKQIGILKSMGARNRQILLVFTLEGLGIAIVGAVTGAGLSYCLLRFLMSFKRTVNIGKIDQLYPAIIDPGIFGVAMLAAIVATVIAAILPARRAAQLNPVDVIRGS